MGNGYIWTPDDNDGEEPSAARQEATDAARIKNEETQRRLEQEKE